MLVYTTILVCLMQIENGYIILMDMRMLNTLQIAEKISLC